MSHNESVLLTDLYQLTTAHAYFELGMRESAVFELFVRRLPVSRGFLVAAGLEQVIEYLEGLCFKSEDLEFLASLGTFPEAFLKYLATVRFTGSVHAMPEGTPYFADEPILRVTAPILEAQLVESRIINLMHFQSMIASKAVRCVRTVPRPRSWRPGRTFWPGSTPPRPYWRDYASAFHSPERWRIRSSRHTITRNRPCAIS
jgi:nicotinate phosphoribosyltransferase